MTKEEALAEKRTEYRARAEAMNKLAWYVLVIFGVPAILGYFVGAFLEGLGYSKTVSFLPVLGFSFIMSSIIFNLVLRRYMQGIKDLELQIKELLRDVEQQKQEAEANLKSE